MNIGYDESLQVAAALSLVNASETHRLNEELRQRLVQYGKREPIRR